MTQINNDDKPLKVRYALQGNGKLITIRAFLGTKLGHECGERLYKELVQFANESTRGSAGFPVVLLDEPSGPVGTIGI
jgi:hypothetical protein